MAKGASIDGSGSCNTHGGLESKGGLAGEAKRLERAAKKLERANEDLASDDDTSMWELKYTFQEPVGEIRITEDWSGEGNGIAGLQWLGGVVLSRYMDSRQVFPEDHFAGRRVIEVGAGCGLTSIYATIRGADVTITDMDIGKCVENIEANLGPRGLAGKARARRLVWGSAEELALFQPPYDVVLAGDCLYEEACISPLLQTMWALAGPETEVLLCGVVGHGILELFLSQVDTYFFRETIDTTKIDTFAEAPLEEVATQGSLPASAAVINPAVVNNASVVTGESSAMPKAARHDSQGVGHALGGGNRRGPGTGSTENVAAEGRAGPEGSRRPGQRALLRLRKKCHARADTEMAL